MKLGQNHDQATEGAKRTRKLRSSISVEILKTLASKGPAPIPIADLHEIFRRKSLSQAISQQRSPFYIYLQRLAARGLLKIEGGRRHKVVVLTSKGEKELAKLKKDTSTLGASTGPLGVFKKLPSVDSKAERIAARRKKALALAGGKQLFFLAYDIPKECAEERNMLKLQLRRCGATMLHKSFYVLTRNLTQIIKFAESAGLLPFVTWGKLSPMAV